MKPLHAILRRETARDAVLPFVRFMELALYCPDCGYYEMKMDAAGRRGDFYTSVSVGALFGQLLAFQFAEWLDEMQRPDDGRRIVEAGAHDGKLAADILSWLKDCRPRLFAKIEYVILEPSPRRQAWQRQTLKDHLSRVRWLSGFDVTTPQAFSGIIFCNELLDAMPVRRLGWDAWNKQWFEWGVAFDGGKLVWARCPRSTAASHGEKAGMEALPPVILDLPSSLLEVLPDGCTVEISPAAERWWREAAASLARGKLMALDYGLTDDELFSPGRTRGTLRAYFRHHAAADPLANPGEQDLTAHVNFSAIQKAGEEAGLQTELFSSQAKFLTQILAGTQRDKTFGEWTSARARQFQTLTHPEHLGRAFRVLVQSRPGGRR
ncbi:MAG: SAM-dependent methyltransferase [Verrucomicrobiota bacterium]|nr:SAM-dependent methyltransferase [Verrucomicrobiota bacterium]